ncbi:MAG: hypothetical protein OEU26_26295, partial [Candidatus Tectomicrobia bacterium]|nr:hypothetical protein [Candidatus Tectomicrobia bacterium]
MVSPVAGVAIEIDMGITAMFGGEVTLRVARFCIDPTVVSSRFSPRPAMSSDWHLSISNASALD